MAASLTPGKHPVEARMRVGIEVGGTFTDLVALDGGRIEVAKVPSTPRSPDIGAFAALGAGGSSDGAPGLRPHDRVKYYAAFVRDPDGNRIEAVTFPGE